MKKTAPIRPHLNRPALFGSLLLIAGALLAGAQSRAQSLDPADLEELIAPIALYPDDVLGIILPASTFPLEIVQAARFLEDLEVDPTLEPDDDWDESIVALLNYPEIVYMMNDDLDWTWELGEAVLTDEVAVLAAAQDFRSRALNAGNLASDERQIVSQSDGVIEIEPADPEVVYIPIYEPQEVIVYQPRPIYRYYPVGYPVYYYPYPAGYFFDDLFWGVTSYFSIGWHTHHLHVHHHSHRLHPYYLNSYYYYTPYYRRSNVIITTSVNNYSNVWQPGPRRGSRPRTVTVDGRVSTARTRTTATTETQPRISTRSAALSSSSANRTRPTSQRSVASSSSSPSQIRGIRSSDVNGNAATARTRTPSSSTAASEPGTRTRAVPAPQTSTRSGNLSTRTRTVTPSAGSSSPRIRSATPPARTVTPSTRAPATRAPVTRAPAPRSSASALGGVSRSSAPARSSSPAPSTRSSGGSSARASGGSTRSSGASTRRPR